MAAGRLNLGALVAALTARREDKGYSWRKLAQEAGVSPSTLTRMQQGKLPDINTFTALVQWLRMPAETFFEGESGVSAPEASPATAVVSALLRSKREVPPKAIEAMGDLMRAAQRLLKEMK